MTKLSSKLLRATAKRLPASYAGTEFADLRVLARAAGYAIEEVVPTPQEKSLLLAAAKWLEDEDEPLHWEAASTIRSLVRRLSAIGE